MGPDRRQRLRQLKVVRIGRAVSHQLIVELCRHVESAFSRVIHQLLTVDYDPPLSGRIETSLLTRALEQEVGGHILGVTAVDLVHGDADDACSFLFGGKDNRNDVAVVSIHRLASRDPEVFAARVLKVALHELGHNFGLVHHYRLVDGTAGGCCPMTKGDSNRFGERAYVRAVIDQRGFGFCAGCLRVLDSHL